MDQYAVQSYERRNFGRAWGSLARTAVSRLQPSSALYALILTYVPFLSYERVRRHEENARPPFASVFYLKMPNCYVMSDFVDVKRNVKLNATKFMCAPY